MSENIKVAVRVRPFNQRERKANSACIISVKGKSTVITNPEKNDKKTFVFDHSYWSHSGYKEDENGVLLADSDSYADQKRVYKDLGKGVLENAWQGYNAALFAYGQTGSGKSYSMIGYGPNKGIVPITCDELFKGIKENQDESRKFQVSFSMIEIYNEQVQDLLAVVKKKEKKDVLKVRQHPKMGFYVEGLKQVPVSSYEEINRLMDQGTVNRTTASTNMNATSSRSHMVITITFKQIYKNEVGQSTTKSSEINLVDLAGSERADSTGATGDRLKEGSAINQSLSTLGNVISALADLSAGKKKVIVPYRDSVLTKLLQGALGGNSRTIMIAALSPAAINYDETLSTLRYADRAKKIQNKAVVNESLTDKLVRELRQENQKLLEKLKLMQSQKGGQAKQEEIEELLQANMNRMSNMEVSWEQKLEEARREWEKTQAKGKETKELNDPYLQNVNEDPQLSGVVKNGIKSGITKIGRPGVEGISIELKGLGIKDIHAVVHNNHEEVYIEPHDVNAKVYVNGIFVSQRVRLMHMDRIKLGSNCLYLYIGPLNERSIADDYATYNYDYFQSEMAEAEGLKSDFIVPPSPRRGVDNDDMTNMEMSLIFQEYLDLLSKVNDVNSMSKEMGKDVMFESEVKNMSQYDTLGRQKEREVVVRVTNTKTKLVWVWSKGKFLNRKYLIEDLYYRWLEGQCGEVERYQDPFWDPVEDVFLGSCHVWLNNLAYCLDSDDHLEFHNNRGRQEAIGHIKLNPCDASGKEIEDIHSSMVFDPKETLGRRLDFMFSVADSQEVKWVRDYENRGIYFTFTFYDHPKSYKSNIIWNTINPRFHYNKHFTVEKVTDDFLEYLMSNALVIELWGTQAGREDSSISDSSHSSPVSVSNINILEEKLKRQATELKMLKEANEDLRSRVGTPNHSETQSSNGTPRKLKSTSSKSATQRTVQSKTKMPPSGGLNGTQMKMEQLNSKHTPPETTHNGVSKSGKSKEKSVSFDAEIAQMLKIFFRDMKDVQRQLSHCKSLGSAIPEDLENLRTTMTKQQTSISNVELNVNNAVGSLRENMLKIIKKKKQEEGAS